MSRRIERQYNQDALIRDQARGTLFAASLTVPSDTSVGYTPGCIYIDLDAAAGSQVFINEGTRASSAFKALRPEGGTFTALTVTTLTNDVMTRSAGAATDTYKANTAAAWTATDGTTAFFVVDTRNTIANTNTITILGEPCTIVSAAAAHQNSSLAIAAKTITYTGTNTVTSSLGVQLYLDIPTFTDASAGTVTTVSTMHVAAVATAGGSLTLTNRRMISTGVSDCFLTNAGVWTDTACWAWGKDQIEDAGHALVGKVIAKLAPRSWFYNGEHGNDRGRERVGIVYDELPEELRSPGEEKAVSAGLLASFALAALKTLWDRNQDLERRLEALEGAV